MQLVFSGNGEDPYKECEYLENKFYKVTINEDGSFNVLDKESQKEYKNQGVLVENGDDGDSFNYSIPRQDMEIYSTAFKPIIQIKGSNLFKRQTSNSKWLFHKI